MSSCQNVAMFGVRFSSLFTSRWMALLWGVLICLSAINFVGTGHHDDADEPGDQAQLTNEQVAAIRTALK